MIRGSIYVAAAAVLLSLLVHGLGLRVAAPEDQPSPAEEAGTDLPDVGADFETFAETVTPDEAPREAEAPEEPEMTPPEQAVEQSPTTRAQVASDNPRPDITAPDTGTGDVIEPDMAEPAERAAPAPDAPETAEPPGGEDDAMADTAVQEPVAPETEVAALEGRPDARAAATGAESPEVTRELAAMPPAETVAPVAPEPSPSPVTIEESDVTEPEQPEMPVAPEPEEAPLPATAQTTTAEVPEDGVGQAVRQSLRPPKARPTDLALGVPKAARKQGAQTGRAGGTMESPLTTYKRTGVDPFATGSSSSIGGGGTAAAARGFSGSRNPGNARTTNYAGQVLVRLNRFPPVNPAARGAAQVSFEINTDGTVAWVKVLRSTGSPEIRRAAAAQVRRAAPFPPPPQGASRRLVFTYNARDSMN